MPARRLPGGIQAGLPDGGRAIDVRIDQNLGIEGEPDRWVHSACGLCSNGCGLEIAVKDERIVGVRGRADSPVSFGHLGPKGANVWRANRSEARGTRPLRRTPSGDWEPVSWDAALDLLVGKLAGELARGRNRVACYDSGQLLLEEYYALAKLWRGGVRSAQIDASTRLCTATSETSLYESFGADGPPASYVDVDAARLLMLFGHNVAEMQTVLWERMLAAKAANGGRIVVVDPRRTPTVRQGADLHLRVRPGTNVALVNGLLHVLIRDGYVDEAFVNAHTRGFEALAASVAKWTPARAAEVCGIDPADLERAATWFGEADRVVSTVLQGFYQSVDATAAASLVNSLHLVTGKIGRLGAGPLQMAGQPSAMSNRETGACGAYPGYRNFHNAKHMRELCDLWEIPYETFHADPPVDVLTMIERMHRGQLPFLWVIGTNPMVSLPDQTKVKEALERAFVVVQDPFVDAETVAHADLYLPVAMWGEKTGCMTNADRSVNLLEKAVDAPGEARTDFDVFVDVARRMGFVTKEGRPLLDFDAPEAAFEEWKKVSKGRPCDYSGMTYAMLKERGAVRWPCNEEHPDGAERLYEDHRFPTSIDECQSYGNDFKTGTPVTRQEYEKIDPHGRAWLKPCEWEPPSNSPHEGRPFVLSTGRLVWHWHTRTKTGRVAPLESRAPRAYVEVHPDDAAPRGIATGTLVAVESDFGRWEGPALVGDVVRPGMLFVPFHFGEAPVNRATSTARDPVSAQPHYKHVAAALVKLADAPAEPWLLERARDLSTGGVPYAARATGGTVHRNSG